MTSDRCPSCNAAVTAGAEWCTLCYTVLRVPEIVPATVPTAPVAPMAAAPMAAAPMAALPPDPILDAPVTQAPPIARQPSEGWPCLGCGALVPLADNACSQCGRPFLPSEASPSLRLPGVGDVGLLDKPQRVMLMFGGCAAVMALLVALAFLFGSVL